MNKLILVKKNVPIEESRFEIPNVVQLDLCNMAVIDDEISDSGWNFISIITKNNGKVAKLMIKLEEILQFSLVEQKE